MNFKFIIPIVAAFIAVSCAKKETQDYNDIEAKVFEQWMEKNAPDAQPLGQTGIYYEIVNGGGPTSAKVDVKGKWVELDYQIKNLEGDIVYNRDEQTAREIGTYSEYAHYVNDRLYIATDHSKSDIPFGLYTAITEIPTDGDTWRVYIPSRLAYSSVGLDMRTGYGGQIKLAVNAPVIIDNLQIVDIIDNPEQRGLDEVIALATKAKPEGWGMFKGDTVKKGLYLDIMKRISDQDTIATNQSANIYYKVRFLDGELLYTNVDSVFYNNFGGIRTEDKTSPVRVTRMDRDPNNLNQMPDKAFYAVIDKLCYGDVGRMLVPAKYAYHKAYMRPDMTESNWSKTATFAVDSYTYDKYTKEDTDYYFAATTYYWPTMYYSAPVDIAEVKSYTPLMYEFVVKRPEE